MIIHYKTNYFNLIMKKQYIVIVALVIVVSGVFLYSNKTSKVDKVSPSLSQKLDNYNPQINTTDFTTQITNKYFTLPVGKKMFFDAESEEGIENIEIHITGETKVIEGVTTLVYLDTVRKNGKIHEITKDYLAQHKTTGDVWYFGEEVDNYDEKGNFKDHAGTFIHGKDGAKAGIWMKSEQKINDSYRQEYFKGEAEDIRDTVSTGLTVITKLGSYKDCVKVYDWTPLDSESKEHKYYCPEVGGLVLTEHLMTGKRSELTKVIYK